MDTLESLKIRRFLILIIKCFILTCFFHFNSFVSSCWQRVPLQITDFASRQSSELLLSRFGTLKLFQYKPSVQLHWFSLTNFGGQIQSLMHKQCEGIWRLKKMISLFDTHPHHCVQGFALHLSRYICSSHMLNFNAINVAI